MSKVKIQGNASGTGVVTLTAPNTNTDRTITLPDDSGELIQADSSGNVGIGTSSTFGKASINSNGAPATSGNMSTGLTVHNHSGGTAINIGTYDTGGYSYIQSAYVNSAGTTRDLAFLTGATERMRIDSAGRVTMPYQLHWHGGLTNTSGAGIATSASTRTSRGGLNFVTDRVTVPVAGVYSIHFNTLSDTSSGRVDASIRLNGAAILEMLSEDNGSGYHYKSGSLDVLLAANDYIQFYNADWYDDNSTSTTWKSASVTLIS